MPSPDLLYLATSATIIEQSISGVSLLLAEGHRCMWAPSKRGARADALRLAQVARDRLDVLIAELGSET